MFGNPLVHTAHCRFTYPAEEVLVHYEEPLYIHCMYWVLNLCITKFTIPLRETKSSQCN